MVDPISSVKRTRAESAQAAAQPAPELPPATPAGPRSLAGGSGGLRSLKASAPGAPGIGRAGPAARRAALAVAHPAPAPAAVVVQIRPALPFDPALTAPRALELEHLLAAGLRHLGLAHAPVGRLLHAPGAELKVALSLDLRAGAGSLLAMAREIARMVQATALTQHVLLVNGPGLPRAVAILREPDGDYSVFDGRRGLFIAPPDALQQVISGLVAPEQTERARLRHDEEAAQAAQLPRSVQLLERVHRLEEWPGAVGVGA